MALAVVIVYLAVLIVVGFVVGRNARKTSKETFVGGGTLGLLMVVPLLFGELIAGASTTGTATNGFTNGLSALYAIWGMAPGCIIVALFLVPFFQLCGSRGAMTGPEAFGLRFGKRVRMAVLVVSFIMLLVLYSLQPKAIASLLAPSTGLSIETLTWIISMVFVLMALAGLKGIAGMNFINALVLFVGMLVVAIFCVDGAGGLDEVLKDVPASYLDFFAGDPLTAIASILGAGLGFCMSAGPINTSFSAKNTSVARKAFVLGAILVLVFAPIPCLIGMSGFVAMPDANPASILFTYPNSISPVLSTVSTLAVAAAVFSTGPFFLLYLSALFTRDIVSEIFHVDDEAKQLKYSRFFLVVLAAVAALLANHSGTIISQILGVTQIQAVAVVVLIIGLHWKRMTNRAAFWSIVLGCGIAIVWHFASNPFGISAFWLGLVVGMVVLVVLTLAHRQRVSDDFAHWQTWKDAAERDRELQQVTEGS